MQRVTVIFNRIFLAILALSLAGSLMAKSELAPAVVGEVSFVLGKATVSAVGGYSVPVSVGLPVHVGDTIETASSGHVHIRFVDNALVSVRPSSMLEVARYDYNAQNPQNSAVIFNVSEGITRAISGQAAKQARQNFRMNTPIAAIGVRGTDFVVSVDSQSLRAIVNEGSIVVAPYSSQCSAAALGPCSQNAVEVSGLSRQMLEMSIGQSGISSALLPATSAQAQALAAEASAKVDASNKATATSNKASEVKELYTDTVTSRVVNTTLATNKDSAKPVEPEPPQVIAPPPPVTPVVTPPVTVPPVTTPVTPSVEVPPVVVVPPPVVVVPPPVVVAPPPVVVVVVPPPAPVFTPPVAEPPAALLATDNAQLVWGRYSDANIASERITVLYNREDSLGIQKGRQATVGTLQHVLFRTGAEGQSVQPGLGVLAFNLDKAQVQFNSAGKVDLMQVKGGQLSLDFNEAMFSTSLQLSHLATGDITFAEKGNIFDGGIFHTVGNDYSQWTAGAVSLDGKEAGYYFEKTLSNGTVEGLTLWSRKP